MEATHPQQTRRVEGDEIEPRLRGLMLRGRAGDRAALRDLLSEIACLLRSYFARRLPRQCPDTETWSRKPSWLSTSNETSTIQDSPCWHGSSASAVTS